MAALRKWRTLPVIVGAGALGLAVVTVVVSGLLFAAADRAASDGVAAERPEDCGHHATIARWIACEGRDHSFWQARFRYFRGTGVPDPAACRGWLDAPLLDGTPSESTCDASTTLGWAELPCEPLGIAKAYRCFVCAHERASSDIDYRVLALTPACDRAITYESTNLAWWDVPERLVHPGASHPGNLPRTTAEGVRDPRSRGTLPASP